MRAFRSYPAQPGSGRKAKVTRDTTGNPGGGGLRGPRRPSDRRRQRAPAEYATGEHATGESADENPWATGLTAPQRSFPVWDGVPGYEFDSRRSARVPPAGPGRTASRGPDPQGGPFWYTPTAGSGLSQPAPVTPLAWLSDE